LKFNMGTIRGQFPIKVVFSDLDGTLIHFEKHFRKFGARIEEVDADKMIGTFVHGNERRKCRVLPTSTMGPGFMSERTIDLISRVRSQGVKFVYVTGARCSTLMERLPIIGFVDAAFGETGGRFLVDSCRKLDPEWTEKMEEFCGPADSAAPPFDRKGVLWDFARELREEGYDIDARSFFFGFRVDLENQQNEKMKDLQNFEKFVKKRMPEALNMASNLGKFDFFPAISGKGNAVRHFMEKEGLRKEEAVALFDDDNDLPMANEAAQCYLIQPTHPSIASELKKNPSWIASSRVGVLAIEEALENVLEQIMQFEKDNKL